MKKLAFHDLWPEAFPFTIVITSRLGMVLWTKTVIAEDLADGVAAIEIPGYGHTEHVPVSVRITYANGEVVNA